MNPIVKPFEPLLLPLSGIDWANLVTPIANANYQLARYEGILNSIINPAVLVSPLTNQEAVLSSKIEGTQATLQEVLEFEATDQADPSKKSDIQEIINYRKAINHAVRELKKRPISLNLLKEIHYILMDSVRGRSKRRGDFRQEQNWLGKDGDPIEKATYIPPSIEKMIPLLHNWESYVNADEKDGLVQLAIVHAQFELIHPFMDGNGRVGRILIPLFLCEKNLLTKPVFYLSQYLDDHRDAYVDRLNQISKKGDWNGWILFFLNATIEQAKINSHKVQQILSLYEKTKLQAAELLNSKFSIQAVDTIFKLPVVSQPHFIEHSKIPHRTALRILENLKKGGVIVTLRKQIGRQSEVVAFKSLLNIVK